MKKLLLLAALLALVAPSATSAHGGKEYKTRVVLKEVNTTPKAKRGTHYFHGKVKSRKGACVRFRSLVLVNNGKQTGNEGMTDAEGRFSIEVQAFPPGDWKVFAPAVSGGNGLTCRGDRSKPYVNG